VYQFTPLKHACLSRCQSPLGFLLSQWREGTWGAVHMGIRYGASCVGCCWALMGVLFVVGVMNLLWVAALGVFVLAEKTALRGPWPGRVTGGALIAWALYLLGAPAM
jgi:predicted metal-binding membrane protein